MHKLPGIEVNKNYSELLSKLKGRPIKCEVPFALGANYLCCAASEQDPLNPIGKAVGKMCKELLAKTALHMEQNCSSYANLPLPILYGSDQFRAELEEIPVEFNASLITSVDFSGRCIPLLFYYNLLYFQMLILCLLRL